jgi:hypothetical protein
MYRSFHYVLKFHLSLGLQQDLNYHDLHLLYFKILSLWAQQVIQISRRKSKSLEFVRFFSSKRRFLRICRWIRKSSIFMLNNVLLWYTLEHFIGNLYCYTKICLSICCVWVCLFSCRKLVSEMSQENEIFWRRR